MRALVVDTNIVLDLLVFDDPATAQLKAFLIRVPFAWIATQAMRDELERVLAYPKLAARQVLQDCGAARVLAAFDAQVRQVAAAVKADVTCRDPDDQKFIDLAVQHRALLVSKDRVVLEMRKRLAARGVAVMASLDAEALDTQG